MTLATRENTQLVQAPMIADAVERYNVLVQYVKNVMVSGKDFGEIPGTNKLTLLKPGAEKLASLFNLRPTFEVVEKVEDWQAGFFYYWYRCKLVRNGEIIAEGEGSCNTKEKKYRWRKGERVCPSCGKTGSIIKGKTEYGGGWLCFKNKGGCGTKFKDGDSSIEGQNTEQVENTEPFDLVNTIQKMAQKRALVAATLIGANASEFFTQDMEDLEIVDTAFAPIPDEPATPPRPQRNAPQPTQGTQTNQVSNQGSTTTETTQTNPEEIEGVSRGVPELDPNDGFIEGGQVARLARCFSGLNVSDDDRYIVYTTILKREITAGGDVRKSEFKPLLAACETVAELMRSEGMTASEAAKGLGA